MAKYNTMVDVAFTVEHDHKDPENLTPPEVIEALQRRINTLRTEALDEARVGEAFGILDTYENEDEDTPTVEATPPTPTPPTTLDELLEYWGVMWPGGWENDLSDTSIGDWWAVMNDDDGIVAFFWREEDADRYRMFEIGRALGG